MTRLSLCALLAFGCGPALEPQRLVLTPTADTSELVELAAAEWSLATGIPITIGRHGIPVQTAETVLGGDGKPVCGATLTTRYEDNGEFIRIERVVIATKPPPGCQGWRTGLTLLHEIGHVLCEYGVDGWSETGCHSERGLMAPKTTEIDFVDSESLATICGRANCTRFEPMEE